MLGTGYENNPNKGSGEKSVVINVTNNYTNSFNKDSNNSSTKNDLSSGKTTTNTTTLTNSNNDSSTNKDASSRKSVNSREVNNNNSNNTTSASPDTTGSNNYNNSNSSQDTKDSPNIRHELDNSQTLSSGMSLQEMFMFLESEEPLSVGNAAGNPPKDDLLTTAMDRDRKMLPAQQKGKKALQKVRNTGKAIFSPIERVKGWLTQTVDSLIKRDEDKVKAEIVESPSYRSTLYKASRLAIKSGAIGLCFTINMYLGAAILGVEALRAIDRPRLRREALAEQKVEMKIIQDKIEKADSAGDYKAKWQMMRLKEKLKGIYVDSMPSPVKDPGLVQ